MHVEHKKDRVTEAHIALHEEAKGNGDLEQIAKWLRKIEHIDLSFHEDGSTLLMDLCRLGRIQQAALLLEHKADPAVTNTHGETSLIVGIRSRRNPIGVLSLLGGPIESRDNTGWSPLHWAVMSNQLDVITKLLQAKANVDVPNIHQCMKTPIMIAAEECEAEAVDELLYHKADVNQKDEGGNNLLHWCCKAVVKGYSKEGPIAATVRVLLRAGCDPTITDREKRTPLSILRAGMRSEQHNAVKHLEAHMSALSIDSKRIGKYASPGGA